MARSRLSPPLTITSITTTPKAVCARIAFTGSVRVADEHLASQLIAQLPTLCEHACQSSGPGLFGDKIVGATLPHVTEHIAIDLLVQANPGHTYAGNTTWADEEHTAMLVRVSYEDAARTQAAIEQAVGLVNSLFE